MNVLVIPFDANYFTFSIALTKIRIHIRPTLACFISFMFSRSWCNERWQWNADQINNCIEFHLFLIDNRCNTLLFIDRIDVECNVNINFNQSTARIRLRTIYVPDFQCTPINDNILNKYLYRTLNLFFVFVFFLLRIHRIRTHFLSLFLVVFFSYFPAENNIVFEFNWYWIWEIHSHIALYIFIKSRTIYLVHVNINYTYIVHVTDCVFDFYICRPWTLKHISIGRILLSVCIFTN